MKVMSKNKTAAHQWDFFLPFFFSCSIVVFPRLPLNKTLLPEENLQAQKTVKSLT